VLLLITGSYDGTSDRIVTAYGAGVFRLNHDLWRDYQISFSSAGWRIVNPCNGLVIESDTVKSAFWWKPFLTPLEEDPYVQEEVKYIFRDIYGWCVDKGIARGNHFTYHSVFGKVTILKKAQSYFKIPETSVSIGRLDADRFKDKKIVVKSLATARTNDGNILITTEANINRLDPAYPWYIQERIDSEWDVTIFYCNKECFAFKRSRADLKGLDWRAHQSSDPSRKEWFVFPLAADIKDKIVDLSRELNISFGRYDFLLEKGSDDLVFLEVNAHGQWVFLDYFEEHGLLDCVVNWLKH
jgi:hypothetical protein